MKAEEKANPGKSELRRFWNVAKFTGGFAFDFESVDAQGRPTTDPMVARPVLLSLATGRHRPYRAMCMEWNQEASEFLRGLLKQPDLTAVAHYHNYDLMQAHWIGCVDIHAVKASIADTRILCWLYNEEEDLDLKTQVWKKLHHRMVSFKEATSGSEFNVAISILQNELEGLSKEFRLKTVALRRQVRETIRARKHEIEALRGQLKGKEINEKKKQVAAELEAECNRDIAEIENYTQQKTVLLLAKIEQNQQLQAKLFKKYAIDDAIQCWRLYLKMMRWVRKEKLEHWLVIEEANHKRAMIMTADGALVNQDKTVALQRRSEPLLEEFKADIFNIAKRQFKVNSNKELPEVLYKDLGIVPPAGTKPSKCASIAGEPWAFSTRTEVLQRIDHPIAQAILDYRSVNTIYQNFMLGLHEQAKNDPDKKSRVHVTFNSTGTVTGRWTSSSG